MFACFDTPWNWMSIFLNFYKVFTKVIKIFTSYLSKVSKCLQPICQNKLKTFKDFTSEVAEYQNWVKYIGLTLLYAIDFVTTIFLSVNCLFGQLLSFQLAIFVCFETFVIFWPLDVDFALCRLSTYSIEVYDLAHSFTQSI